MTIQVTISAFRAGETIPTKYTDDGEDISPPISWANLPAGTKEIAMICDDPDAPRPEPWVHWVIYAIPADAKGLSENVPRDMSLRQPPGTFQGENSWGKIGYGGPAPPKGHGTHHYHFRVCALDAPLHLTAGLTKEQLLNAIEGHVLTQGELVGTYSR